MPPARPRVVPPGPASAPATALGVLVAANLLNNRLAPRAYVPTSLAATGALLAIARRAGCSWEELGLDRAALRRAPGRAATFGAVVGAGYALAAAVPHTRPLLADGRVAGLRLPQVLCRALVRVPLGTVALEEVGFRGVLPALLRRRYGAARASAVSAALFGLWHLLPAWDLASVRDPAAGPARRARAVAGVMAGTAVGGVALGALRRFRGGLFTPMAAHAALNGWGYLAAWAVTVGAPIARARPPAEARPQARPG